MTSPNPPARCCGLHRLAIAGLAFAVLVGCDTSPNKPVAGGRAPAAEPPSPEASFERFLSELRRRVEGEGPNERSIDGGGSYVGGYRVLAHELVPPETPDDLYRAWVTIGEKANITVIIPQQEDQEEKEPQQPPEEELPEGFEAPGELPPSRRLPRAAPLQSLEHDDEYRFELAFVEGRWRLKTTLDAEFRFLPEAFRLALKMQ